MAKEEKHLSESIEDYIETIYIDFSKDSRGVRITDLAQAMGVSKASANDAVKKLKSMGYVEHEKYGQIYLTEAGEKMGVKIYDKHTTITKYLTEILGVSPKTAEQDACCIEHIISNETFEKMKKHLNSI